jgi:hypothetical protein
VSVVENKLLPSMDCDGLDMNEEAGSDPGSSASSNDGASAIGVVGAVFARPRPCAGLMLFWWAVMKLDNCGDLSISFMTAIKLVALCTAASCSICESSLRAAREVPGPLVTSSESGGGL